MEFKRVEHVAIAVHDLDEVMRIFQDRLGLTLEYVEAFPQYQSRMAMYLVGQTYLELPQGTAPSSEIAEWVAKRGQSLYHVCLEVPDIEAALDELRERGVRLLDEQPREGHGGTRIAFLDPGSTAGVLFELVEIPASHETTRDRSTAEHAQGGRDHATPVESGRFFDDLRVGEQISTHGRTMTEADMVNFAGLTGDINPLHMDEEYAKRTRFGRRLPHGQLVFVLALGLAERVIGPLFQDSMVAFYGVDRKRFVRPVFLGDTIKLRRQVQALEPRTDGTGVVTFDDQVSNQRDELCLRFSPKYLLKRRR
jgi:methylmalonyl-CoA epimerase